MYTHCQKLSTTISICSGSISTCIYWYGYKRNPIIVKHEIPGIQSAIILVMMTMQKHT